MKHLYKSILKIFRNLNKFYIHNFYFFLKNKKNISNRISFIQKTLIRGNGNIFIGEDCSFGYKLGGFYKGGSIEIQPRYEDSIIKIGNNVRTNNNIFICAANFISIGDNSLIGQGVSILDHEPHGILPDKRGAIGEIGEIIVGNNVWIGNNVTILKKGSIGDNSIIATGAVVTKPFPSNCIIGGIPARIIKKLK